MFRRSKLTGVILGSLTLALSAGMTSSPPALASTTTDVHLAWAGTKTCLDGSVHAGVRVDGCNSLLYQSWEASLDGSGVKLEDRGTTGSGALCLDGSVHAGVVLNSCNSLPYQSWSVEAVRSGVVRLKDNGTTGSLCLEGNSQGGVGLAGCNTSSSEQWDVTGSWPTPPAKSTPTKPAPTKAAPVSAPAPASAATPPVTPVSTPPPVRTAKPLPHHVKARVSLSGSARWLLEGQSILLKGRIRGGGVRAGALVILQGRAPGQGWTTFWYGAVKKGGHFKHAYRFHATTRQLTYQIRAVLPSQIGYRSKTARSGSVKVTVSL